jgi:hypothetical protein
LVKSLISGRLIGCENFDFGEVYGQIFLENIQYMWVHRTSIVCVCYYLQPGTINAGSVLAKWLNNKIGKDWSFLVPAHCFPFFSPTLV